jgi:3-phenylpropionate/trans-cinnamate dioxygenase ferredoxin subunit
VRRGEVLKFPWCDREFDVRTWQLWRAPETALVRQYAVSVEAGGDLLKGPYVIEAFQVAV